MNAVWSCRLVLFTLSVCLKVFSTDASVWGISSDVLLGRKGCSVGCVLSIYLTLLSWDNVSWVLIYHILIIYQSEQLSGKLLALEVFETAFVISFQGFRKLLFRRFFNRFILTFKIGLPVCMFLPYSIFELHSHTLLLIDFILLFTLPTFRYSLNKICESWNHLTPNFPFQLPFSTTLQFCVTAFSILKVEKKLNYLKYERCDW